MSTSISGQAMLERNWGSIGESPRGCGCIWYRHDPHLKSSKDLFNFLLPRLNTDGVVQADDGIILAFSTPFGLL
jgi:hypothetical protein